MTFTKATYHKLIGPDGQPQYGCFSQPFSEINHQDFDYHTTMDRPAGSWQKYFHFNQFQFIGLSSHRYSLACAIANVRYLSNAFVYLFDQETQQLESHSFVQPLALGTKLSNKPYEGQNRFQKGRNQFEMIALPGGNADKKGYQLNIKIGDKVQVDAQVIEPANYQPLVICSKTGYNGWCYTQKAAGLEASGVISWNNQHIPIESDTFLGNYDWSCGYMRRQTAWNWASFNGKSHGNIVGLNLAAGVNETGLTENGFWVNGSLHRVGPVQFQFDRKQRMNPWLITTENQQIQLEFKPTGIHKEQIDAVVLASNFSQMPGHFYGSLTDAEGNRHIIDGVPGVVEDHYAKW